jgi:hypothetical protein
MIALSIERLLRGAGLAGAVGLSHELRLAVFVVASLPSGLVLFVQIISYSHERPDWPAYENRCADNLN